MSKQTIRSGALALLALLSVAGCSVDRITSPWTDAPTGLEARYSWISEGWRGVEPVGQPAVELSWSVPSRWNREPFRVYARRAGQGSYLLQATVTSCADGLCRYTDVNVDFGRDYDYFVAAFDERSGEESASTAVRVRVPAASAPAAPAAPRVTALDGALFVSWTRPAGADQTIGRYRVFLVAQNDSALLYEVGTTDGDGFLDSRAVNGVKYDYRVAAVDLDGHPSRMSPIATGIPRPDARGQLIYAWQARPDSSGFRFRSDERTSPVVHGASEAADWRLEVVGGSWTLRPTNGAAVHAAGFTTDLVCGPGSDAGCIAVREAPSTGYTTGPVPVTPEHSYVFRVDRNYGVVRVTHWGMTLTDRPFVIVDWAFQTRPDSRQLHVGL
jgi:hypothetical protein